jgi:hypothetical protein
MKLIDSYHKFNYANSLFNVYHANKGEGLLEHNHNVNHAIVCHVGKCLVKVNGKEIIMDKQTQPIDLPSIIPHEIEALEDNTVFVTIFKQ